MTSDTPVLVYIYGPPGVGKLTVATALSGLTGFPLFHNHLTVDAVGSVFAFGSTAFSGVLHRMRLDVFETAARERISLIFTNNSAWAGTNSRERFVAFTDEADRRVSAAGGRVVFVQLWAPLEVLEARVGRPDRATLGKLTEPGRLRELVVGLDQSPVGPEVLELDTTSVDPDEAAKLITAEIARVTTS